MAAGDAAALGGGAIAGIVVGVVAAVVMVAALVVWLRRSKKEERYELDHCPQPTYVDAPEDGKDVAFLRKTEPQELATNGDYSRHVVHEMSADTTTSRNT